MNFEELKFYLKTLSICKKHLKKIYIALILSLIVAASTGIAWLLDPAVKKFLLSKIKYLLGQYLC